MLSKSEAAAEILLGLGVAALGGFILYETGNIRVAPIYSKVGPAVIPYIVGGVMAILGLALSWEGWRVRSGRPPANTPGLDVPLDAPGSLLDTPGTYGQSTDWKSLALIGLGLAVQVCLLDPSDAPFGIDTLFASLSPPVAHAVTAISGFIPTETIVFVCVAAAFGSRRPLRDVIIGLVLASIAYVGFVYGLRLPLPAGILAGVL
ncbi:MAG TPA: tripartite tricarboxylate transporter TctB family protein [Dongiaceae bacterium]|jgi:putative tricarboxylic transport membrane protein|nr:tripartite tricarboxylate transporter TctB family protein [Dongiaceae bacterium]